MCVWNAAAWHVLARTVNTHAQSEAERDREGETGVTAHGKTGHLASGQWVAVARWQPSSMSDPRRKAGLCKHG